MDSCMQTIMLREVVLQKLNEYQFQLVFFGNGHTIIEVVINDGHIYANYICSLDRLSCLVYLQAHPPMLKCWSSAK